MNLKLDQKPNEDLPVTCDLFKGLEQSILSARDKLLEIRKDCVKYTEALEYIDDTIVELAASLENPLQMQLAELHLDTAINILKRVNPSTWAETKPIRDALEKVYRFLDFPRRLAAQERVLKNIQTIKHSLTLTGNKYQVRDLNDDLQLEENRLKIITNYLTGLSQQGVIAFPKSQEAV